MTKTPRGVAREGSAGHATGHSAVHREGQLHGARHQAARGRDDAEAPRGHGLCRGRRGQDRHPGRRSGHPHGQGGPPGPQSRDQQEHLRRGVRLGALSFGNRWRRAQVPVVSPPITRRAPSAGRVAIRMPGQVLRERRVRREEET